MQALFAVQNDGREPQLPGAGRLDGRPRAVPLLYQPGEAWLYDTCSALQGVLVARVSGQPLPELPGRAGVRAAGHARHRLRGSSSPTATASPATTDREAGGLDLADGPDGQWSARPAFPLGNGGLAGTVDDWLAFARMLLAGAAADGRGCCRRSRCG